MQNAGRVIDELDGGSGRVLIGSIKISGATGTGLRETTDRSWVPDKIVMFLRAQTPAFSSKAIGADFSICQAFGAIFRIRYNSKF